MRVRFTAFGLAGLLSLVPSSACHDDGTSPVVVGAPSAPARVEVTLDPFTIVIRDAKGSEILRTLTGGSGDPYGAPAATHDDGTDATKVLPGWDGYAPDERPWTHGAKATLASRTDTRASFALDGGMRLDVTLDAAKVTLHLDAPAPDWNKTTLAFALRPDEHFFGLGERFASVDHRGLSLYSWAEEGSLGAGEGVPAGPTNPYPNGPSMTYFPVPFFLSSAGYAMQLVTTRRTETHFGSERPDAWRAAANATTWDAVVYVHDDPLASIDDFTRDTGRPFVPATWVFGPVRRVGYDSQVNGVAEWDVLRTRGVPTTTLDDAVHFLPSNSQTGRDAILKPFIADAHAKGYKVVAYNNPYVAIGKDTAQADADFGTQQGFFAKTPDGQVGMTQFISGETLEVAEIDLTNPDAVAWFQQILKRTIDFGYDGWMHDFGEYTRRPWLFHDGRTGEEVHNEFPVLSAKAAHDLLVSIRPDDFLFYVRSGYTGTAQWVPAVWGGDAEASFDDVQGIPSAVRSGLNLGMSGVPTWGSDLSGFKCVTHDPHDKEMYLRWAEIGAVSPFMLEENACANPIGSPQTKWKLWNDDETVTVYGNMSRLHTRLAPYFEVLARLANATGAPIMRHPFLVAPHEAEAWKVDSAFFLGPSLYASPVVHRGDTTKDTWLPAGRYVDLPPSHETATPQLDDLTTYEGGQHVGIPAPLDKLPLLVKDGGIVPMLDASVMTLGASTDPSVMTADAVKDRLDVLVALSRGQQASITLADGTVLTAARGMSGGVSSGLAGAAMPADTQTCTAGCFLATAEGSVDRLRVSSPPGPSFDATQDDVVFHAQGPVARRYRFDVLRLR
jgi:alpha-glucosidase (family GH31 glycosyl hydrolase)